MKLLIAADICTSEADQDLIKGDVTEIAGDLLSEIQSADVAIVNLESPVVDDNAKPIDKFGPNLKTDNSSIEFIKRMGFSVATLANNHILDYGKDGIASTIQCLDSAGIAHVGAGSNLEDAKRVLYLDNNNIAIVNCCESEFNIATESTAGANPINPVQQWYSIHEARQRAKHVIVIIHGGHEGYQLPSPRMKETYRFFIDAGADAVINHHQHCFSGYEIYKNKPIFYGLGNFYFPEEGCGMKWREGYMVELILGQTDIKYKIHPYRLNDDMCLRLSKGNDLDAFNDCIAQLNAIIADDTKLKQEFDALCDRQSKVMHTSFIPYRNKYLTAAWWRGLMPIPFNKQNFLVFHNYINCESHRDIFLSLLKKHF